LAAGPVHGTPFLNLLGVGIQMRPTVFFAAALAAFIEAAGQTVTPVVSGGLGTALGVAMDPSASYALVVRSGT
jgi:hypothetical protein